MEINIVKSALSPPPPGVHWAKSLRQPVSVDFFWIKPFLKRLSHIYLVLQIYFHISFYSGEKWRYALKNKLPQSKKKLEVSMIITVYSVQYVLIPLTNIFIDTWNHHISVAHKYTQPPARVNSVKYFEFEWLLLNYLRFWWLSLFIVWI